MERPSHDNKEFKKFKITNENYFFNNINNSIKKKNNTKLLIIQNSYRPTVVSYSCVLIIYQCYLLFIIILTCF
jgi:hypothetical protein